jgi:D-proline reductase (dithiol) PrdB
MMADNELRRRIGRLTTWAYSHVPGLAGRWGRRFDAMRFEDVPFARPRRPLARARVALITTGGVHLDTQAPFDMADPRGDASFRAIPADTPPALLRITHDYYDHRDAERDMNILFPMGLMRELVAAGRVGSLATCYSFMGHIEPPHLEALLRRTAPQVAGMLKQERVDAALLTPA